MPCIPQPVAGGPPADSSLPPDGTHDDGGGDDGEVRTPHLDVLLRSAAYRLDFFSGPIVGRPVANQVPVMPRVIRFGRREQQLDHGAYLEVNPPDDPWLDGRVINNEFITRYNGKELSDMLYRHYHGLKESCRGRVQVLLHVLAVGTHVPAATSVRFDTLPDDTPLHAPITHIGQFRSTDFPESDRQQPIFKIIAIMLADGQTEAVVEEAVQTVFGCPDADEFSFLSKQLFALADGRREFQPWIYRTYDRETMNMSEEMQEERRELFVDMVLRNSPFRGAVQEGAEKIGLERGRKQGHEKGLEEGVELGKKEAHVRAVLAVLRDRDIELSPDQKSTLRSLDCAALPEMRLALHAKDADDFARLAGLSSES